MSLARDIRERAERAGAGPRKRWGQNFLIDEGVLDRIAQVATDARDTVLEIGPGPGTLTERLAARAAGVVAVERDPRWAAFLTAHFAPDPRVRIVRGDATRCSWPELLSDTEGPAVLAGNLPYNLSGPLLMKAWHARARFGSAIFMLQAEVAQRLAAAPGSKTYGSLSVLFRRVGRVERSMRVPAGAFWPAPKVESAVVRIHFDRELQPWAAARLERVVRAAFGQRRKTLRNALTSVYGREEVAAVASAFDLERRAEQLDAPEFEAIAEALDRPSPGRAPGPG